MGCLTPLRFSDDPELETEGFKLFNAKGKVGFCPFFVRCRLRLELLTMVICPKVWAHRLTPEEVATYFPAGRFVGTCTCIYRSCPILST